MAPLSAPNNVAAAALSTNSIQVTWGVVTGAASYKVYRATSATGTRTLLDTVTTTSYTSGGLEARTYWYFITSINTDGIESALSAYASMMPKPNVPANVGAYAANGTVSVSVSWYHVSGAESYRIYYATSLTGTKTLVDTTTVSYYDHYGTANATYYYWITAYNAGGESDYSLYTSARTPPAAPLNLRTTSVTTTSVTLAWNTVAGASYYYVDGVTPPTTTGISYIVSGCDSKTWYYFNVRAYNSDGNYGPWSEIAVRTN
jgi:fibronectin type 3 domain-containing protein